MSQCPTCGSDVPERADVCPDCGMDLIQAQAPVDCGLRIADCGLDATQPDAMPSSSAVSLPVATETSAGLPPANPQSAIRNPQFPVAARLTLKRSGVLTGETFPVGDRVTLGRFDPDSGPVDVDLGPLPEAAYVSRLHAEMWRDGSGQWFIKDAGSRNGTFVRDPSQGQFQRVMGECAIAAGAEIALGNARFEFHVG